MARPRKYVIKLTEDEYKELKSIIRKKATSKTIRCRCQIILDLDESHGKFSPMSRVLNPTASVWQQSQILLQNT